MDNTDRSVHKVEDLVLPISVPEFDVDRLRAVMREPVHIYMRTCRLHHSLVD